MPKTRSKNEENPTPEKKRGRKKKDETDKKNRAVCIRLDEEQHSALETYLAGLNAKRVEQGAKPLPISTWLREVALQQSGNSDLGAAAKARAAAQAADIL